MAFSKNMAIDRIEILENGVIQVRIVNRVFEDGVLIGDRFQRIVYEPDMPLANIQNPRIRAHANIEWTPAIIAAYIVERDARLP